MLLSLLSNQKVHIWTEDQSEAENETTTDEPRLTYHISKLDFKPCLLIPNDLFAASPQKDGLGKNLTKKDTSK